MTMFVTVANALSSSSRSKCSTAFRPRCTARPILRECSTSYPSVPTDYDLRRVSVTYDSNSIGTTQSIFGQDRPRRLLLRLNALIGEGPVLSTQPPAARAGRPRRRHTSRQDTVVELNYSIITFWIRVTPVGSLRRENRAAVGSRSDPRRLSGRPTPAWTSRRAWRACG